MNDKDIINSIKGLAIDMIDNAKSGHPGIALGAAPIIYTLYSRHMNINVDDPYWINRDRFVLSGGHGSALLYSMLFYVGYLKMSDLKEFRRLNSITPGHPEYLLTPGVDTSTGPLGQGVANAVGMAIAQKYYEASIPNSKIDYYTYVMCGDGDLMEGISYEALSLAGTLKLNKLIVLYDSNDISLDGSINLTFKENIKLRFESMGFKYLKVLNGESVEEIDKAIKEAKKSKSPTIIEIKTIIGKDSLNENTNKVHGSPLDKEDIKQLKEKLNLTDIPFSVDYKLVEKFRENVFNRCENKYKKWKNKDIKEFLNKNVNILSLINDTFDNGESLREINGKVMNEISNYLPSFIGGSADLFSSTKVTLKDKGIYQKDNYSGRNIYYGVREHAMAGISNGLALSGLFPFLSTFLAFSDYMKPSIRLTALMNLPVTYIFTHDSVNIGSDGATHQPIEQLSMLRNIPNFRIFRPADANEIIGTWNEIIKNPKPTAIVLSRISSEPIKTSSREKVSKGAYIVKQENGKLDAIIIATGTEVSTAIKVATELEKENINLRVVSMPCISLYELNSDEYKESILPAGYKRFVIEAGCSSDWHKYVYAERYLININEFGKSGTKEELEFYFKLDSESIKKHIKEVLK